MHVLQRAISWLFFSNQIQIGHLDVQLTPALTDFKGLIIYICYRRISVIAIIENKEKLFKELKNSFCYKRYSGIQLYLFPCICLPSNSIF